MKQMFLCRVAVGEYCLGKDGQNAPDERHTLNIHRHILYDSTTDNMEDNRRHMFVVYHDAQACKINLPPRPCSRSRLSLPRTSDVCLCLC